MSGAGIGAGSAPSWPDDLELQAQEEFKREWAEMIGLYRVITAENTTIEMAGHASAEFDQRAVRLKLGLSTATAMQIDVREIVERLAPRSLLKPAKPKVESPFGPLVTAESEADLADIMRLMESDPALRAKMRGNGYLVTSNPRGPSERSWVRHFTGTIPLGQLMSGSLDGVKIKKEKL